MSTVFVIRIDPVALQAYAMANAPYMVNQVSIETPAYFQGKWHFTNSIQSAKKYRTLMAAERGVDTAGQYGVTRGASLWIDEYELVLRGTIHE